MPEREEPVQFNSLGTPAIRLAGRLHLPSAIGEGFPAVILAHPQPLVSDMDDPLVMHLARDLVAMGMAVLRFNFRGVPPSEGDSTDGRLEILDLAGAVTWLLARPEVDGARLALVGHAFGAYAALGYAAIDQRVQTVVAISPPCYRLTPDFAATLDHPKFFVTGDDDEVCPRHKLEPWMAHLSGPKGLAVVPDAQHLMRGREAVASEIVVNYLARWAQSPSSS